MLCTLFMSLACVHIHWLCAVCDFLPSRLWLASAAAIMPPAVITPPRARARRGRLLPLPIRVALALVILALTFDSVGIGLPTQLPGSRSLWTFDAWRRPQTEPLKAFLEAYILQGFSKFYRHLGSLHKEFQKAFKRAPENLLTAFERILKVFGKPLKGL